MPRRKQATLRRGRSGRPHESKAKSVLRGVADELGLTDPETGKRPRRKGPIRITAIKTRTGGDVI
jgi:hypothetical protein